MAVVGQRIENGVYTRIFRATLVNTANERWNSGWISDFENRHKAYGADDVFDYTLNNTGIWAGSVEFAYEPPELFLMAHVRMTSQTYSSGGDFGFYHRRVKLPESWKNDTVVCRRAGTLHDEKVMRTIENDGTVYVSERNVIGMIPFTYELAGRPETRVQDLDWGSFIPCIYRISGNPGGLLTIYTNCIRQNLEVHFAQDGGRQAMFVRTDHDGKFTLLDNVGAHDQNRRIRLVEQHVHRREGSWYPLTARVSQNVEMFDNRNKEIKENRMLANLHFQRSGNDLIVKVNQFTSWSRDNIICYETGQKIQWRGDRKGSHGNLRDLVFNNMAGRHRLTFGVEGSNFRYEVWAD